MANILILSQRCIKHKDHGGAEVYIHNAFKEVAKNHNVVQISQIHEGLSKEETVDGIKCIRLGKNLLEVTAKSFTYYKKHKNEFDLVIDHTNTHQFMTFMYVKKEQRVVFYHQLAQEVWHYSYKKPVSSLFWKLENILVKMSRGTAITVSKSTQDDLEQFGYKEIYLCPEGNYIENTVMPNVEKGNYAIIVGRQVPYKKAKDAVYVAKSMGIPLKIVGSSKGSYLAEVLAYAKEIGADVDYLGRVSYEDKKELIEKAYLHIFPSIREGWGLVITEAANLGTPSLVYDRPGVRDAVDYGNAGFMCRENTKEAMATMKSSIDAEYDTIRKQAFEFSLKFSWEQTALEMSKIIDTLLARKQGGKNE